MNKGPLAYYGGHTCLRNEIIIKLTKNRPCRPAVMSLSLIGR